MTSSLSKKLIRSIIIIAVITILYFSFKKAFDFIDSYFPTPNANDLDIDFNDADKFIKHGYGEIKALSTQLLTLVTAILVFSVTFSEKIVNFNQTKDSIRFILIAAWAFFIFAIISDGIGLAYNAYSFPFALSDIATIESEKKVSASFYEPAFNAIKAILMGGVFFIAGLICIVLAGVISIFFKPKTI